MGTAPERVTESVSHKVEGRYIPEVGDGNFGKDPEGVTTRVDHEAEPTKSGYLTFYSDGISTLNRRKLYQESDLNKAYRGKTNKSKK